MSRFIILWRLLFCPFSNRDRARIDKEVLKKTLKGIITNPIIIGIVVGLLWSAFRLPFSGIPAKTVTSIGNMATPMGLMAMGATFDIHKASAKAKPSIVAAVMKLVGFAASSANCSRAGI